LLREKVAEVYEMVNRELGCPPSLLEANDSVRTYLYVRNKRIVACLLCEEARESFDINSRVGSTDTSEIGDASNNSESNQSTEISGSNLLEPVILTSDTGPPHPEIAARSQEEDGRVDDHVLSGCLEASAESVVAQSRGGQFTSAPLILGVRAIWVHETARRKGVAAALIDTARRTFLHGFVLPRVACAFTAPTADGHAFAVEYCGTNRLLLFNP
jgi:hypothetical protein